MDRQVYEKYNQWMNSPLVDNKTKMELNQLCTMESQLEDRFYKDLSFGTAGMRGILGAGTNRMNVYTVRKTSQGLANYILASGVPAEKRKVAIAYDSRHCSKEFAEETACVLAGNGIFSCLYSSLRPTPQLSFTVRNQRCTAGVMITASHNPAEYNGYKVYWEDGAQISSSIAAEISQAVNQVTAFEDVKQMDLASAISAGWILKLGEETDQLYQEEVKRQSLRNEEVDKIPGDFKVIYTPLHGTGNLPVRQVLKEQGFCNVIVVPEQELPNGDFPTVKYPNPEEKETFSLAIELAERENAPLIIGTDPDADRIGAVVKLDSGEYQVLTGNQMGALLVHYILSTLKEQQALPENGVIIKTIVTSQMGADIAASMGVETMNTLTGFKYIGEKIKEFEARGEKTFVFGYEESYGYLKGTYARDKDAVVTAMLICEMAADYHSRKMTLWDGLTELYKKYGFYWEGLKSIVLEGKAGLEKIQQIMEQFRSKPIQQVGKWQTTFVEDYLNGIRTSLKTGSKEQLLLPFENALKFIFHDGSWLCLRPSGTEPKLKIYAGVKESSEKASHEAVHEILTAVAALIS